MWCEKRKKMKVASGKWQVLVLAVMMFWAMLPDSLVSHVAEELF
jgi:hypothetical protein